MQDQIIIGLLGGGTIRFSAINGTKMVADAQKTHSLSRVCTAALGRQLQITSLMSAAMKGEDDRITTIIKGGGPAGSIVCSGRYGASVKGYIQYGETELPPNQLGKLDVSGAVGNDGKLTIIRDLGMKEPYTGECALVSGEIAEDFAQYYMQSEQQPSIVYAGVRVSTATGEVKAASALLVQPLPDCPEIDIDLLEELGPLIPSLTVKLEEGMTLEDAITSIFSKHFHIDVLESAHPEYLCDCSRERTEQALIALGESEIKDMIAKDGGAELSCHFCNTQYAFDSAQLAQLLEEAKN